MGYIYQRGLGVAIDFKEVVKWYELAAVQDHVNAQINMGVVYFNGENITSDYESAYMYFSLAARSGNSKAI